MPAEVGTAKVCALLNIELFKQLGFQKIRFVTETEMAISGRYWRQVDTCRL